MLQLQKNIMYWVLYNLLSYINWKYYKIKHSKPYAQLPVNQVKNLILIAKKLKKAFLCILGCLGHHSESWIWPHRSKWSPARILNLKVIASQQKATLIACLDIKPIKVIASQLSKQQVSPARILNLKVIASQNKGKMITCPLRILTEKGSSISTESNNYCLPRYIKPKSDRQSSYKATSIACQNMKPKSDRQSAQYATMVACQDIKT